MNRREFNRNFLFAGGVLGTTPLSRLMAQNASSPLPAAPGDTQSKAQGKTNRVNGVIYGTRAGRRFPLPDVRVSNGREVVLTGRLGRYQLPVQEGDIVFVVKPRGYALPVNDLNLPRFYRIHQPAGSPPQKYPGIAPTGGLPLSLNFTLQAQPEPDEFRVLLFGDPQSRNQEEIDFLTRDIIANVAGEHAAFGVSLGDQSFDDPAIYPSQNRAIATLGMPWFNIVGNHDLDFDAPDRTHSTETFKATFGPTYYSFDYGSAHFIVLDNVAYHGKTGESPANGKPDLQTLDGKRRGSFHTELGAKQLEWLKNDLSFVPRAQLVVIMMHIPLVDPEGIARSDLRDLTAFFRLIENRPHTLSISGHTHFQTHLFLGREAGFNGTGEHHHFNQGATCGSWWHGMRDARGIPQPEMRDGTPNGHAFLNVKGHSYSLDYRAARRPANYQMNIYAPAEVAPTDLAKTEILANVFAGSKRSRVEMQIASGQWRPMQLAPRLDPAYLAAKAAQEVSPKTAGRKLPVAINSPHIWAANLPEQLPSGAHMIRVRALDMWGKTHEDRVIIRVT